MNHDHDNDLIQVEAILSGKETSDAMLKLGKNLAQHKEMGYARRVLDLARTKLESAKDPKNLEIFQKCAVYTYKDPDLPADWRLKRALEILETPEPLNETRDGETLGIAGAIYKRKWEIDAQRQNIELSLFYYLRGYAQGAPEENRADILGYLREKKSEAKLNADKDRGYTGINAAFVLDLLAYQEEEEARKVSFSPPDYPHVALQQDN